MEHQFTVQASNFLKTKRHHHFIAGAWRSAEVEKTIKVVNPATEAIISEISMASDQEVDLAIGAARKSFEKVWRRYNPTKRQKLLLDFADLLEAHQNSIAEILTLENGKLFGHARSEIKGAANTFRYYAGWATKIEGETLNLSLRQKPGKQNFGFIKREPIGVVAAIVPWNFPISIAAWKLAPLLAAGCTAVLKPSEVTPLSTLYLAELFNKAGFPPGVVNIITGDGHTGAALTSHKEVDKITFTGSTEVGKLIGKAAMEDLREVSLELGGKSPAIIFDDADLEEAVKGVAMGIFRNGGQVCVAGSRAYIHRKVFDKVVADLAAEGQKMRIGHGFEENVDLGPLVTHAHLEKVYGCIQTGLAEGSKLISGGNKIDHQGYYIEPTVFATENNQASIVAEEIFGPVLVAIPFDDKEEALWLANDTKYGLSSTVWTKDISTAMDCVDRLNAGWVFVNSVARSDPSLPLGGNKQSGIGRELGKAGVYNYTKMKSVNIVY